MNTLPRIHLMVRKKLCEICPTKCEAHQANAIAFEDPAASCPLTPPQWVANPITSRTAGLGDAVAFVAKPFARAIDRVAGTDIANCKGCTGAGGRKDRLNRMMPDITRPLRREPQ